MSTIVVILTFMSRINSTLFSWFEHEKSFITLRLVPEVIKLFSCTTQLSTKFILIINVKMPTIVGIITFISVINTTSERLKARNFFVCLYFSFYEHLKFCTQLI